MTDVASFKLIIEDDEGRRSIIPVDLGEVSIGRLDSNTIRLDERNVSRQHARLLRDEATVFAEDLDSYNGVWVNGDRIQGRYQLHEGDLIRVGDFHLELRGEGLQRRTEETTQRTMIPVPEATQPQIRMGPDGVPQPPPRPPRAPAPASALEQEPAANEATAIIRMDAPELKAPHGQTATIAGQKAKLVCVSTQFAGRELEIGKTEVVIGRTGDNDLAIDHRSVSRHHAKIVVAGRRFLLHDLKSANGTFVNGETYAQTELKRGDLIELGHVKLRFVPPGESYTLTPEELAATRAAPMLADGDEETVVPAQRNLTVPLIVGGAAALVVLVIALVVLLTRPDPRQPSALPVAMQPSGGSDPDALLGRAHTALAQRHWEQALTLGNQVLAASPQSAAARELVAKAHVERQAQAMYDEAQRAVETADFATAWRTLQALPPASVYADQSRALAERVKVALVADLHAKGRNALEAQDYEGALTRADEISAVDPGRTEAAQLRGEVEHARAASRRSPAAPTKAPPRQTIKATPRPAAPSAAAAPPPPSPTVAAPAAAPAGSDAKAIYAEAVSLLKGGELTGAIDTLNRCVQADPAYAQCYRALGIAHARSGNGAKAAKYYKQYLKVDPNAADADKVRQLLEQYETAP